MRHRRQTLVTLGLAGVAIASTVGVGPDAAHAAQPAGPAPSPVMAIDAVLQTSREQARAITKSSLADPALSPSDRLAISTWAMGTFGNTDPTWSAELARWVVDGLDLPTAAADDGFKLRTAYAWLAHHMDPRFRVHSRERLELVYDLAIRRARAQHFIEAARLFREALAGDPMFWVQEQRRAVAYDMLMHALERAGDHAGALAALESAEREPADRMSGLSSILYERASRIEREQGRDDRADRFAQLAIESYLNNRGDLQTFRAGDARERAGNACASLITSAWLRNDLALAAHWVAFGLEVFADNKDVRAIVHRATLGRAVRSLVPTRVDGSETPWESPTYPPDSPSINDPCKPR
jgi:tetratricopeptide (TPR) repeat protein